MSSSTALPDWLAYRAATTPDRDAIISKGSKWSFAELNTDASRVALRLAGLGARPGDRIAALLHNSVSAAVLVHAVLRLGVTLVPLNIRLTDSELAWQLGDSGARLLIVDDRTSDLGIRVQQGRPELSIAVVDAVDAGMLRDEAGKVSDESTIALRFEHEPDSVLAIIYTSGTTGRPKGAMLTVGNFWWSAIGSALNIGSRDDDRWLVCLPLFHVGGLSIILRAAICGFAAVIHDGFDAGAVNRALDEERITIVSVVAVMLERMLDARYDRPYPSELRCVLLGGGPARGALLERCASAGIPVAPTYGLTETTSQIVTMAPEDMLRRPGSAGRPLYPNELRIVTGNGSDALPNEPGEIIVRGPVVMAGYAGQPEATAAAVVDGWLRTGDIGHIDADGYLHVLERRDDLIITGGENVYPAEVESALLDHPMVAEAAVVGVTDEKWGQKVVAIVRLVETAGASATDAAAALMSHCASRLARYKVPAEFRIAAEPLPRTASGKLRRAELRERVAAEID